MKKLQIIIIALLISLTICAAASMLAKANPGSATQLVVSSETSQIAGVPFTVTVTAEDAHGNTITEYTDTVNFTSSDSGTGVVLPSNYTFMPADAGVATFSVTLVTAGSQSITATDTSDSSITGSQTGIMVDPASASTFSFGTVNSPQITGDDFSITITALDAYGNTATNYIGKPILSDLTGTISPTSTSAFEDGVWTGSVAVTSAGSDSITATEGAIAGTSNSFTVNPVITVMQGANGAINPGTTSVNYGGSKSFLITPNTGYSIASLTVDGSPVAVASSYTFSNVQVNQTITATFAINTYTFTVYINGQGSVTPGNGTHPYGTVVNLTATSADGWTFGGWSNDATSSTTTLTMDADQTITANFIQNPQTTSTPTPTQTPTITSTPTQTPTATPTPSPASTSNPSPTSISTPIAKTKQNATPALAVATMGQYLPVVAAALILGAVIIGLVIKRRKAPNIIVLS